MVCLSWVSAAKTSRHCNQLQVAASMCNRPFKAPPLALHAGSMASTGQSSCTRYPIMAHDVVAWHVAHATTQLNQHLNHLQPPASSPQPPATTLIVALNNLQPP
jgi:hypothetical protein